MSSRLSRIVAALLRHVPDPPKPVARPTASFAGLKVGQRIGRLDLHIVYEVVATDSQGADLRAIAPWDTSPDSHYRLEDRNWKLLWTRGARKRKRKESTK